MSFPVDIPNPNQDNVFYTIPALKAELLNWFATEKIDAIKDKYKDYFLPTFVFDTAGAPTVYNLDVYPKNGPKESLQLDQNGNIVDDLRVPDPVVKSPDVEYLTDGAYSCTLDPKFYVDTILKEPNDLVFTQETALETLDLLVATKYHKDQSLSEKVQNFAILKNLLLGQLKILPDEELQVFKEEYRGVLKTIDNYLVSLEDVAIGQSKSIDALKFESFYEDVYNQVSQLRSSQGGFVGTQLIVGQALADLANVFQKDGENYRIRRGTSRNDSSSNKQVIHGPYSTKSPDKWGHTIWPSLLEMLEEDGLIEQPQGMAPRTGPLSTLGVDYEAITKFEGTSVFSKDGKPSEWYYENLKKSVAGEEADWSSLETFVETIKTTTERYINKATLDTLGGQHLLVDQAIMKAILKLCMTNLDVSEYAPRQDGTSFFSSIGRSPSLGPSGTTPWPSKNVIDPESYQVKPYTNNAFLCYHALIALVHRFNENDDEMTFLIENIAEPDSDHDKVIALVKKTSYAGEGVNRFKQEPIRSATEGGSKKRDLNELLHLFPRMTTFPLYDDVILIPKQDSVPVSERSFLGWNLPASEHTTEHTIRTTLADENNYNLLKDDHSSAVNNGGYGSQEGGKLRYNSLPDEYIDMGYLGASPDAVHNMRLFKVNYGIGYEWANSSETIRKKNVLGFFKQRRYSMPYFWASMTSLWRALALESWKNMIESVNDILGTDIKMTNEDLLSKCDHPLLWKRIKRIFKDMKNDSELTFNPYVSGDGTISFTEKSDNAFEFAQDTQNTNTPGLSTRIMMQEYVRFVSLVSDFKSVQIKDVHSPVQFDVDTYLPSEGLTLKTNINFANSHGGSGQYLEPTFGDYFDKLVYTNAELSKGELVKKHILPVPGNVPENFTSRYTIFLHRAKTLFRHTQMFEHIQSSLSEIKTFVKGFSVPEGIQEAINDGRINLSSDLDDPAGLIEQIGIYKEKYKANESGLGNRWDWTLAPDDINARAIDEEWLYIHVLGIKRSCFDRSDFINLQPEYIRADSVVTLPSAAIQVSKFESDSAFDRDSELLLRWMHLSSGLDICELSFSKDTSMIYSDSLIESESKVFPWEKGDFDEGVPTKPLETIYNMSPWLFSQNMFNDICVPNTYHRVVACVITKQHLKSSGIGLELLDGKIDDIIGSIRWKKI